MTEVEITRISFPHFEPIYVLGEINPKIKKQIQVILNALSFDPYAGYSPSEQRRREIIEELVKEYDKPKMIKMHSRV